MSKFWKYFFPGYLLALPHTLIGVIICELFYGAKNWRWSDGCLECEAKKYMIWGTPSAQTHGFLIVYADKGERASIKLRAHERVHVVQAFLLGPVFPILYGLFFVLGFAGAMSFDWHKAYMWIPFERSAYRRQELPGVWGK